MARAGLTIGNPELLGTRPSINSSDYALPAMDFTGLAKAQNAITGALAQLRSPQPEDIPKTEPSVFYNSGTRQYAVGDITFDADDYAAFVELEPYVGQTTTKPVGGGWEPIDEAGFKQYVGKIKNPTTADLFGRGIDIGFASGKQLLGSLAQFAGAEGMGGRITGSATRELEKLQPYQRNFTDIQSAEDFGAFVASNLGQQVPNIIASILTGGAGYAIGGATALGRTSAARYVGSKLLTTEGREAFMKNLQSGTAKQLAKKELTDAERDALIQAGRAGGAAIGVTVQNYLTGVADLYNESQERGVEMDETTSRLMATLGGIPYAVLDTIPELGYAKAFLTGTGKKAYSTLKGAEKAAEFGKRAGLGALKSAPIEAATEGAQEGLLLGLTGQPFGSEENINRLINAMAAGATVGATLGGISNLSGPVDLTKQGKVAAPMGPAPTEQLPLFGEGQLPEVAPRLGMPSEQMDLFGEGGGFTPSTQQLDLFGGLEQPAFTPTPAPMGAQQLDLFADYVPPPPRGTAIVPTAQGEVAAPTVEREAAPMGPAPTEQLPLFGEGQLPEVAPELAARMMPSQAIPMGAPPVESLYNPQQGALQFAPAAPMGTTDVTPRISPLASPMARGLAPLVARAKTTNLLAQRERELEAQRAAQREAAFPRAEAQRELQFAEQAAAQEAQPAPVPMRGQAAAAREPVQEQLFTRRQAPPLSAGERRRQGILDIRQEQPTVEVTPAMREREGQLRLGLEEPAQPKKKKLQKGKGAAAQKAAPEPKKQEKKGEALKKPAAKAKPEGKPEDTKGRGRLAKGRQDRNVKAEDQKAGGEAGRGDGTQRKQMMQAAVRQNELKIAGKEWPTYTDENQPKWNELTPEQQEQWRKLVVDEKRPSIAAAEEIAPPKKEEAVSEPQEEKIEAGAAGAVEAAPESEELTLVNEAATYIASGQMNSTTEAQVNYVLGVAFIDVGVDKQARQRAIEVLNSVLLSGDDNKKRLIANRLARIIKTAETTLDAKGGNADWYKTAAQSGAINLVQAKYVKNAPKDAPFKGSNSTGVVAKSEFGLNAGAGVQGANFYRADTGGPITSTIVPGKLRMIAVDFVRKLANKPNLFIYANVGDLRTKNKKLYDQAAAARTEGDFDTTRAVGYSFGNNVILFTDYAVNEDQVRFVLAHETMGHFGFRAIMSNADLNKMLNAIYDADAGVREGTAQKLETYPGMSKLEAIEEYLADQAAMLDVSLVRRIWSYLKNALNKLGLKFSDDAARYLISQSRKYVRRGNVSNVVSFDAIARDINDMISEEAVGRYSQARHDNERLASALDAANTINVSSNMVKFYDKLFGGGAATRHRRAVGRALERIQTLDNMASKSPGLLRVYNLFAGANREARRLTNMYRDMTEVAYQTKVSETDKEQAGTLLAYAALSMNNKLTDEMLAAAPNLISVDSNGTLTVDTKAFEALSKKYTPTLADFQKGLTYKSALGVERVFKPQFDVTENSNVWKIYTSMRATINQSAIDLLTSNYKVSGYEILRSIDKTGYSRAEVDAQRRIREVAQLYSSIYRGNNRVLNGSTINKDSSATQAEKFITAFMSAVADNDAYKDWVAKTGDAKQFADLPEYNKLTAAIDMLRADGTRSKQDSTKTDISPKRVAKAIRDYHLFAMQNADAELYAKRTIMGAYVPFARRGDWQVKVDAVDAKTGSKIEFSERGNGIGALPYFRYASEADAQAAVPQLEEVFKKDDVWKLETPDGEAIDVKFRISYSVAESSPSLADALNFNEMVLALNKLNINLSPRDRERIVVALTDQNNRARKNLLREGAPGWDKDMVRSAAEHLESVAHISAKKPFRAMLEDTMNNQALWVGSKAYLNELKAAVAAATTDAARNEARRNYERYRYQFMHVADVAEANKVDGIMPRGQGLRYKEEAKKLIRWFSDTANIADSTEDLLSGGVASQLKLTAVTMQLGGSVASAVLNFTTLITNVIPYLGTYSSDTGFGGGYGTTKSASAVWQALSDTGAPSLADEVTIKKMLDGELPIPAGLTKQELQFLYNETLDGTLQAAQANAMLGTARGSISSDNRVQTAIRLWMSVFNYTESASRRAAALATFRLEVERLKAQGGRSDEEIFRMASSAAQIAVDKTVGNYSMFNRPEMARGNILQYLFMYKQYVIMSVQLMKHLPTDGRLWMLGALLFMSGMKGIPFAEDLLDLIDTLAQKFNLKVGSAEATFAEWVDSMMPGMSSRVLNGVLNDVTGWSIASRTGHGDLIPLTGVFKEGAKIDQELKDAAGPVFGALAGLFGLAAGVANYGAEAIGFKDDTTNIVDVMRNSGFSAIKAAGDTLVYLDTGAIVNNKGQVVSREVGPMVLAGRMLGFYPAEAAAQNNLIRLGTQLDNYRKAIRAEYVTAAVNARLRGDLNKVAEIKEYVRKWNADAEAVGLGITNFDQAVNRAYDEASKQAISRYIRAASKAVTPEIEKMARIYGVELTE